VLVNLIVGNTRPKKTNENTLGEKKALLKRGDLNEASIFSIQLTNPGNVYMNCSGAEHQKNEAEKYNF
jgi:hypothetical protein